MKNNKGFSLVEMLAVVVILGILITFAIFAYTRYKIKAINQSYKAMSENAANAAENYFMDHTFDTYVTVQKLFDEGYLSNIDDPAKKTEVCQGKVIRSKHAGTGNKLDVDHYTVGIVCRESEHQNCVTYPEKVDCNLEDYFPELVNSAEPEVEEAEEAATE